MDHKPTNTVSSATDHRALNQQFELRIVQQPKIGRTLPRTQRVKGQIWPVDPPPVVELVSTEEDPARWFYIHNPSWFCLAEIEQISGSDSPQSKKSEDESKTLVGGHTGSWTSSLHKVKGGPDEEDKREHGYFVFGDICVRKSGTHRLKFTLFEMRHHDSHMYAATIHSVYSSEFRVQSTKPENVASTRFSRLLSDAGVKVKLRAETTKRKQVRVDWSSRQTESMNRQVQLAPVQGSFMPPPSTGARGRNNVSVDISERVQTSHAPLSAMHPRGYSFPLPAANNNWHPAIPPTTATLPPQYNFNPTMPEQLNWEWTSPGGHMNSIFGNGY